MRINTDEGIATAKAMYEKYGSWRAVRHAAERGELTASGIGNVIRIDHNEDALVEIPPEIIIAMGFPHSITFEMKEDGSIVGKPSQSKWSNRQIKKYLAKHNLVVKQ